MRRSGAVTAWMLLCTCCQESFAQPGAIQTWVNKGHDNEVHTDADIDPDDFKWQELDGRCCFDGHYSEEELEEDEVTVDQNGDEVTTKRKWVSVDTCRQCNTWGALPTRTVAAVRFDSTRFHTSIAHCMTGQPEASCHKSKGACRQCGIELYCEGQPPPLLGGNKVCVGASRVGKRKPRAHMWSRQTTRRCAHCTTSSVDCTRAERLWLRMRGALSFDLGVLGVVLLSAAGSGAVCVLLTQRVPVRAHRGGLFRPVTDGRLHGEGAQRLHGSVLRQPRVRDRRVLPQGAGRDVHPLQRHGQLRAHSA